MSKDARHPRDGFDTMGRHPLAGPALGDVMHACPSTVCAQGAPLLCALCLGTGLVTGDQLDRYVASLWQRQGEATTRRLIAVEPI